MFAQSTGMHPQQINDLSFTPISLFAEPAPTEPERKPLSKFYAPYGRLIPCELIVTVDSSSIQTPIIALVTDDIYHDGRLIIPAGTEVHGTAQADRKRERIASNGGWTLVWRTGEELHLEGIALDREKDPNGEGWGITDGSAGLRGQVLKTDNMAEIKLFAATLPERGGFGAVSNEADSPWYRTVADPPKCPVAGGTECPGHLRAADPRHDPTRRVLRARAGRERILPLRHTDHRQVRCRPRRYSPRDDRNQ